MKLVCQQCGRTFEGDKPGAGGAFECPACGAEVRRAPAFDTQVMAREPSLTATVVEYLDGEEGEEDTTGSLTSVLVPAAGERYRLGEVFARGGMGSILDVLDVNIRRKVAMKMMNSPEKATGEEILRFVEEAQITGQLEHPGIVPVHELGADVKGNVFYTMKYVKGVALRSVLEALRRGDAAAVRDYPLIRLLTIFQKVGDAVAFAHSRGVMHCDLKPDNVMIGDYGEVWVMDWGLAKLLPSGEPAARPSTVRTNVVAADRPPDIVIKKKRLVGGTPLYMAPEQARGEWDAVGERTDVYALGAILYNILTLHPPVREGEVDEVLELVSKGRILHPSAYETQLSARVPGAAGDILERVARIEGAAGRTLPHCPGGRIPDSLAAVAMKALALLPEQRYASVKELQRDIEAYQSGFATKAEKAGALKLASLWIKRHRTISAAAAVFVLAVLVVGGILVTHKLKQYADWGRGQDIMPRSTGEMEKKWLVSSGNWEVRQGKLLSIGEGPSYEGMIYFGEPVSGDMALECDAMVESEEALAKGGDLSLVLAGEKGGERRYFLQLGGRGNTLAMIQRQDRRVVPKASALFKLEAGRTYHVRAEKDGEWLRLYCDGKLLVEYRDIFYLGGGYAGIYTWGPGKKFWNVRLYRRSVPELASPLATGNAFLRRSRSSEGMVKREYLLAAVEAYGNVYESHPERDIGLEALLRMGYAQIELGDTNAAKKCVSQLEAARKVLSPDALLLKAELAWKEGQCDTAYETYARGAREFPRNAVGIVGLLRDHLSEDMARRSPSLQMRCWRLCAENASSRIFDCTSCGLRSIEFLMGLPFSMVLCSGNRIASLDPLKGMELASLECDQNQITSLEPLKGMPLTSLSCSGNRVASLEPLRGIPLSVLACDENRITNLEPVRAAPLTKLSADGNEIGSLEPLQGMKLVNLSIRRNCVSDLSPLKGMPLKSLNCDRNPVTNLAPLAGLSLVSLSLDRNPVADLQPLRGMPLATLSLNACGVSSLDPLKGVPLTSLSCASNRIASLEPLRGMPLARLMCPENAISNLDPLADMSLSFLCCHDNPLASLEPFVSNAPPAQFYYEPSGLPLEELERAALAWSNRTSTAARTRDALVLLARRKRDAAGIRGLAARADGHTYARIPCVTTWMEARDVCAGLGGHLVTIRAEKENDLLKDLVEGGETMWIGFSRQGGKSAWVTGEAISYRRFSDLTSETTDGNGFYSEGRWRLSANPSDRMPFILEWDN